MYTQIRSPLLMPPAPPSAWSLLLDLCSGAFSHRDGFGEAKHRIKFALRSLLTLPQTLAWLDTFRTHPLLFDYLRQHPRVAKKPHRPYLHKTSRLAERLETLKTHYQFECYRFPCHCVTTLLRGHDLPLASLDGRDGTRFSVLLTHNHPCDKEGELSLQLRDAQGRTLVYLTFAADHAPDGYVFFVGGLQGPRRDEGDAASVRRATRALHGLFPKRVALEALTMLARGLHVRHIVAAGKRAHVYNAWRYRRRFAADHDSFFEALGGVRGADDHYRLPLRIARKPETAIASKKRAEYQRRHAMLDAMHAQILATLNVL